MGIINPPNEVFANNPNGSMEEKLKRRGEYESSGWTQTVVKLSGGMYSYYSDHPYPRKGHPYPEAIAANNIVKRLFIGVIMIFKNLFYPKKILETTLIHLLRLSSSIYFSVTPVPYLNKIWYKNCGRELWDFTYFFLKKIGIKAEVAYDAGKLIATLIEYDDAYQYRIEDIFTESSKELLMENPRKEIKRLMQIYLKRENCNNGEDTGVNSKFKVIAKILSLLLLIPKMKRAFIYAISELNFQNLQLDDESRYYCLTRIDYNFFGSPIEARLRQFHYMREKYFMFKKMRGFA